MATASQPKPSVPNQHTINITDLRTETREILENAHFRGWHYVVQRAGQPMIAILVGVTQFSAIRVHWGHEPTQVR